jgi:hypothetical protein
VNKLIIPAVIVAIGALSPGARSQAQAPNPKPTTPRALLDEMQMNAVRLDRAMRGSADGLRVNRIGLANGVARHRAEPGNEFARRPR